MIRAISMALLLCVLSAAASAGEVLYNGIVLPDIWPPRDVSVSQVIDAPWLHTVPDVIPIDVGRQLFVDDFLIESTTMKREFYLPKERPDNPILKPDQPVEQGAKPMAMPFSDGVWYDPKANVFKMWYMAGYSGKTAYAMSKDGIHWDKNPLDVMPGTNIVLGDGARDSSTVWLDQNDTDPSRRYKMWQVKLKGPWHMKIYASPDGIHWGKPLVETGPTGDRTTVFYNPFRKVWVYGIRDGIKGFQRFRRYYETKDPFNDVGWKAVKDLPIWVNADEFDPQREDLKVASQLYNLDATPYESVMLGLFTVWRGDKNIPPGRPKPNNVCVGFSRDGFHWARPDRRPFIGVSEDASHWNWGNVQSAGGGCLVVGDELYFYYSGRAGVGPKARDGNGATGLAVLRRDGFASMDAGAQSAELLTRKLRFNGSRLFVNANAASGELRVEIADEDGKPIAPFTLDGCEPIHGDKTRVGIHWKSGADLSSLAGKPVRIRFRSSNVSLFSFWVAPDGHGASMGYVAAGGPGLPGSRDTAGEAAQNIP